MYAPYIYITMYLRNYLKLQMAKIPKKATIHKRQVNVSLKIAFEQHLNYAKLQLYTKCSKNMWITTAFSKTTSTQFVPKYIYV